MVSGLLLVWTKNAHTELLVDDSIAKVQDGVELSAMSFNVWVSGRTAERDASVIQMVLNYMPDVVGFQAVLLSDDLFVVGVE